MMNSSASGHRSAFSQTCNLLSQYVKDKKAIGDLSLGMFVNADERGQNEMFHPTTMNLFPVKAKIEEPASNGKSVRLFPQQAGFAAQLSEIKSSPMTIFYAGQVIVFNDFLAHKAKEIMDLAGRVIPHISINDTTNPNPSSKSICSQESTAPIITDLPIARKASLHRFLEKRKDRIKAKAPYITGKAGDDMTSKASESNPWLGLGGARGSSLPSRD